jgi:regulator of protease activity HflC (stomatin/prohibitin superfamily)
MSTSIESAARVQERSGWREGRPVEDPEKTKRWGFVTAKPSEYLVHVRRGKVLRSSGQGATCFKWPWDAVAVVPTSLQRLTFRADQVTLERVGVEVVGLAVYRIAEPLIAYRVLNFSYAERAQQKLEEALGAMFVGATRRLVANLSVDDCLQKRKSALAAELIREIEPVVRGEGKPEDYTEKGWGIVIDTIEIQEVRVLSEKVFAAMQAPFRAQLERSARQAKADTDRDIATREADCTRQVQEARLASELAVREKRAELEIAEAEAKKAQSLREAAMRRETEEARLVAEAEVRQKEQEIQRAEAEALARDQVAELERTQALARAEIAANQLLAEALAQKHERLRVEAAADAERRRLAAEVLLVEAKGQAEGAMAEALAERELAEARARVLTAENLPKLAAAVGQKFGEVKVTHIGNGESPFGSVAQAIASVVELARNHS